MRHTRLLKLYGLVYCPGIAALPLYLREWTAIDMPEWAASLMAFQKGGSSIILLKQRYVILQMNASI
jgi:hypothetical protein